MINKNHTKEQMIEYAKNAIKSKATLTQDGHPNEGRMAKRLADDTYLISDDYDTYIAYPLANGRVHLVKVYSVLEQ